MAINIVTGLPGHGKGLYVCSLIEQACSAGRPVFTNVLLSENCPHFDDVALIDTDDHPVYRGTPSVKSKPASADYKAFWHYILPGSVIIIDEADGYFDCMDSLAMGRDVRLFHKQTRKLGLDIYYVVQRLPNLYVRIRRMAERFVVTEWTWRSVRFLQSLAKLIGVPAAMRLSRFIRDEFGDEDFSPHYHITSGFFTYREASRYFDWYRTDQLVGDLAHLSHLRSDAGLSGGFIASDASLKLDLPGVHQSLGPGVVRPPAIPSPSSIGDLAGNDFDETVERMVSDHLYAVRSEMDD